MSLQLKELRSIARKIIVEERALDNLRVEALHKLGQSINVDGSVDEFAESVNECLDTLERRVGAEPVTFDVVTLMALCEHDSIDVRKIVARTLPRNRLNKLVLDSSYSVRIAAAKRAPLNEVRQALKQHRDDAIAAIYRDRCRLEEAGVKAPKNPEYLELYDKKSLGASGKTHDGPELSDVWYEQAATKLFKDYGHDNIEYNWEEIAVKRLCSSTRATSHVEIDEKKLLDALRNVIEEYEDFRLECNSLKEIAHELRYQAALNEQCISFADVPHDPVRELVESRVSDQSYIDAANKLFNIRESTLPKAIRKYRLGEVNSREVRIPALGKMSHGGPVREIDERALDRYVKCWSERQALDGEPLKLDWYVSPCDGSTVSFTVTLE